MRTFFGLIAWGLVLLLGGFVVFVFAAGPDTELKSKYEQCVTARANGTAASISDFVCPAGKVGSQYDIAYQIAVDIAFKKLDKEVETALQGYQWEKSKDPVAVNTKLVDWFDATGPKAKDSFPAKYRAICQDLQSPGNPVAKVVNTFSWSTTDSTTGEFLYGGQACLALVDAKMGAYRDMGYLIGLKNATESYQDDKATFVTELNTQYENFLMQWTVYIGELARIKSKWNIKTKTQNG
jgi:hypothetical protein